MPTIFKKLGPTQTKFCNSKKTLVVIIGPFGEGKTVAGIYGMLYHARRNINPLGNRPLRVAVVRDTFENLKNTTVIDMKEELGDLVRFKDEGREFTIYTKPRIYGKMFGVNDLAALSKFQGFQAGLIWIEEPAPVIEKGNAGIPEETFLFALTRATRQIGIPPRLQITMNPAEEEHWTYRWFVDDIMITDEHGNIMLDRDTFFIPYGENKYLSEVQRNTVIAAFRNRPDLYSRYVLGEFASVDIGVKVTPEYNPDFHKSKTEIMPIRNLPGIRCFDAWLNPACILAQQLDNGRLLIIDTVIGQNTATKQFIQNKIIPLMEMDKWRKIQSWRDTGDPSMLTPDQSDIESSAARTVERLLNTRFEPAPALWVPRREAVKEVLNRNTNGEPTVLLNSTERYLHKALKGGWCYAKDKSGNVIRDIPMKNEWDHIGHCFSYLVAKFLPWKPTPRPDYKSTLERSRKRAQSYITTRRRRYR